MFEQQTHRICICIKHKHLHVTYAVRVERHWLIAGPGAEYSVLAAYSIQTQHCGNQVDITLRYGVIPRCHACPLPWVTQIRAKASKDKGIQPQVVHSEKGLQLKVLYWCIVYSKTRLQPELCVKAVIFSSGFQDAESYCIWITQHVTIFNYLLFSFHSLMMFYTQSPLNQAVSTSI